jgi:hypothetical protein
MNNFKRPVRLIQHPGNDFVVTPEGFVADLKAPAPKTFEVSNDETFEKVERFKACSARSAAQHLFTDKNIWSKELRAPTVLFVQDGEYDKVYVRSPEGVVTAWVVTAHVALTYSTEPGAI